jgi:hypothetical protein
VYTGHVVSSTTGNTTYYPFSTSHADRHRSNRRGHADRRLLIFNLGTRGTEIPLSRCSRLRASHHASVGMANWPSGQGRAYMCFKTHAPCTHAAAGACLPGSLAAVPAVRSARTHSVAVPAYLSSLARSRPRLPRHADGTVWLCTRLMRPALAAAAVVFAAAGAARGAATSADILARPFPFLCV